MRGARKGAATSTTIIKRSSRKAHHGVHTGAWKVAFADFTLAMMALFMVLWIVGAVSEDERRMIIARLNGINLMEGSPFTPISSKEFESGNSLVAGGDIPVQETRRNASNMMSLLQAEGVLSQQIAQGENSESLDSVIERSRREMEELARIIMQITSAHNAQSNLNIEIVPQGLRILIQDDKNREMFQRGSATLTPFFDKLLLELAPIFDQIENKIIITGHTDSARYRDREKYNNWNLSGERAMAARYALEKGGMSETHILQVSGMSDQMLLNTEDPMAASNRRIEIMVLTRTAEDTLYQFFGNNGENIVKPTIERLENN